MSTQPQQKQRILQQLTQQLKQSYKYKKFDIKTIQTYGTYRSLELEVLKNTKIHKEIFKELLTNSLKVCYLVEPILYAYGDVINGDEEWNSSFMQESTLYLTEYSMALQNGGGNSIMPMTSQLKLNNLLKILIENLFYQHMIKLKINSIDTVINLVNNRSTQINSKVVIVGLLVYCSKRLTLEEIGTAMLIFSLEEALLNMRPYGLPLDCSLLQKCLKKIQRIININQLKNFISTLKQEQKIQPLYTDMNSQRLIPGQYYIGPDQFLLLVSMSEKRAGTGNSIFFMNCLKEQDSGKNGSKGKGVGGGIGGWAGKFQGVQAFINNKKNQNTQQGSLNKTSTQSHQNLNKSTNSTNLHSSQPPAQSPNPNPHPHPHPHPHPSHHQTHNTPHFSPSPSQKHHQSTSNIIKIQKIQGQSFHHNGPNNKSSKILKNHEQVYKEIKQYIWKNRPQTAKSSMRGYLKKSGIFERNGMVYNSENISINNTNRNINTSTHRYLTMRTNRNDYNSEYKYCKSQKLQIQMQKSKNQRPASAIFNQSIDIVKKNQLNFQKLFGSAHNTPLNTNINVLNSINMKNYALSKQDKNQIFKTKLLLRRVSRERAFFRHSEAKENVDIIGNFNKIESQKRSRCNSVANCQKTNDNKKISQSKQVNMKPKNQRKTFHGYQHKKNPSNLSPSNTETTNPYLKPPSQFHNRSSTTFSANITRKPQNYKYTSFHNNFNSNNHHGSQFMSSNGQGINKNRKQLKIKGKVKWERSSKNGSNGSNGGNGSNVNSKKVSAIQRFDNGCIRDWVEVDKGRVYCDYGRTGV